MPCTAAETAPRSFFTISPQCVVHSALLLEQTGSFYQTCLRSL